MASPSRFESRIAKISYSPETVYNFASDMRNFRRFVPSGTFSNPDFRQDSCSFIVNPVGTVKVFIKDRVLSNKIVYSGNALLQNDFDMILDIRNSAGGHSEIKLSVEAELNPFLLMLAKEPLDKFLETIMDEMEKFEGWNDVSADTESP
ncbi:MAG TPA: hypothetical protein PLO24_01980 [Bacteroidales bacterium]|jgi:hypothetical protein|nr:hypothetical protein [Bacteroidales bacterium]HOS72310.1 hypothetical protein [Bacteroidales bacterium]HQH22953.1 hypothetical protein [Bacteroidales bacterium]HQJ82014.1 hypothetical protein [Bacteroidales bacterium]